MSDPATFGDLLREHAILLGLTTDAGAASVERLSEYLTTHAVAGAGTSAVRSWFFGDRVPRRARMERVLDVLGVHGVRRLLAYRLAAAVEPESAEATQ